LNSNSILRHSGAPPAARSRASSTRYGGEPGIHNRRPEVRVIVRRRVAVIATPGLSPAALAAKSATTTIPIVFTVGQDPVRLGLVASLARPGGNATGFNLFTVEVQAKRLGILRELMPKATRIALLVNPAGEDGPDVLAATAGRLGLETIVLNAGTSGEISLPRWRREIACPQAKRSGHMSKLAG
jgi:hypothetical protein